MTTGGLPEPDCTNGCDEGWVYRYEPGNPDPIESKCGHCGGTGKEPPLTEVEMESRGQAVLPL